MFFQKSDFVAKAENLKPSYQDIIILVKRDTGQNTKFRVFQIDLQPWLE